MEFIDCQNVRQKLFDAFFALKSNQPFSDGPHFWEVGSEKNTEVIKIVELLKKHYNNVEFGRYALNPHHCYFICDRVLI